MEVDSHQGHPLRENRVRRTWLIVSGMVLAMIYLMPVPVDQMGTLSWLFWPIAYLFDEDAELMYTVVFLSPLVLATCMLTGGIFIKPIWRGVLIAAFGIGAIVSLYLSAVWQGFFWLNLPDKGTVAQVLATLGAWWLFHIGMRVRVYRPNSTNAYVIGAAGGIIALILTFIPREELFWWDAGIAIFQQSETTGTLFFVCIAINIAGSTLAVILIPNVRPAFARPMARIAYSFFLLPSLAAISYILYEGSPIRLLKNPRFSVFSLNRSSW